MANVPTFDQMMNPLLKALKKLGGSGTIEEIDGEVADIMELSDEQLEVLHNPERSSQTEVEYRLAWTRTYLKKYGLLENSSRGVWVGCSVSTLFFNASGTKARFHPATCATFAVRWSGAPIRDC